MSKKFLYTFSFFLLSISLNAQQLNSKHFILEKLDEGIFVAIHKTGGYAICNAGIIDLGDETLVFDCFISPDAASDLRKAAEESTGNKVRYLVNSHFHNDHIRGNQIFFDTDIISTIRTKELIAEYEPEELKWEASVVDQRIEEYIKKISEEKDTDKLEEHKMWLGYYKAIKESFGEYKITLPNKFLKDTLVINGTERKVIIFTQGKGHTESDIVLWLPKEKILFTGDLLFVGRHPWLGDGFISDWVSYLEDLKKLNAKFIVPGHGPIGNNYQVDLMINYINTVNTLVDNSIVDRLTEDELKATPVPDEFKTWWFSRFFTPNLVIQYKNKTENLQE